MSSDRRLPVWRILLISLLAILTLAPAASAAGPVTPRRIALGVSMLPDRNLDTVDQFTASVGRAPATWSIWSPWSGPDSTFPDVSFLGALKARRITPMIWWYPHDVNAPEAPTFTYKKIMAGHHDGYIRAYAEAAAAYGGPILLRLAHEHNGRWFSWSIGKFNNTGPRFVKAWRHIWNVFKGPDGAGATNVKFLWSPMNPCRNCSAYAASYPGDAFVDYVGFTAFNWGGDKWMTMEKAYTRPMNEIAKLTRKRVIVTETGSSPIGGDKVAWLTEGYPAVYDRFPQIKAIAYFNVDSLSLASHPDWRLTTPTNALDVYRDLVSQERFQGRVR